MSGIYCILKVNRKLYPQNLKRNGEEEEEEEKII